MTTTINSTQVRETNSHAVSIGYTTVDDETLARVMSAARSTSAKASISKRDRATSPIASKPFSLMR